MEGKAIDIEPLLKNDPQFGDLAERFKETKGADLVTRSLAKRYEKNNSLDWLLGLPKQHPEAVKFREDFKTRALIWEAPSEMFDPRVWRAWTGYDVQKLRELAVNEKELPPAVKRFVSITLQPKSKLSKPKKGTQGQMVVPGTPDSGAPPALAPGTDAVAGEPLPPTLAVLVAPDGTSRLNEKFYPLGFPEVGIIAISGEAKCSGVLIAPTVVVTAAHCVADEQPQAVGFFAPSDTGPHLLKVTQALQRKGRLYAVARVLPYPQRGETSGDVALLFLATDVQDVLKFPVLLVRSAPDMMQITFVAYGRSSTNANDEFRELQVGWQTVSTKAKDSPLLVWKYSTGDVASSNCKGDSGAPLYFGTHRGKVDESRVLVGIVSSVLGSCESGEGQSNLLDESLRSWICDTTRSMWAHLCIRT